MYNTGRWAEDIWGDPKCFGKGQEGFTKFLAEDVKEGGVGIFFPIYSLDFFYKRRPY